MTTGLLLISVSKLMHLWIANAALPFQPVPPPDYPSCVTVSWFAMLPCCKLEPCASLARNRPFGRCVQCDVSSHISRAPERAVMSQQHLWWLPESFRTRLAFCILHCEGGETAKGKFRMTCPPLQGSTRTSHSALASAAKCSPEHGSREGTTLSPSFLGNSPPHHSRGWGLLQLNSAPNRINRSWVNPCGNGGSEIVQPCWAIRSKCF